MTLTEKIIAIATIILALSWWGFIIWVILKVLAHFGVI